MIRREVSASLARAIADREQIGVTERQLATAEAGFREDLDRIRGTIGLPIEVTNSLDLLAQARLNHLRAILNYDRSQFRLFVSLGAPPPLDPNALGPLPPAPVAEPPLPLAPVSAVLPSPLDPTKPADLNGPPFAPSLPTDATATTATAGTAPPMVR